MPVSGHGVKPEHSQCALTGDHNGGAGRLPQTLHEQETSCLPGRRPSGVGHRAPTARHTETCKKVARETTESSKLKKTHLVP